MKMVTLCNHMFAVALNMDLQQFDEQWTSMIIDEQWAWLLQTETPTLTDLTNDRILKSFFYLLSPLMGFFFAR